MKVAGEAVAAVILSDPLQPEKNGLSVAVVILGICMALALVLSVCLSRRFVLPIQRIAGTAKDVPASINTGTASFARS